MKQITEDENKKFHIGKENIKWLLFAFIFALGFLISAIFPEQAEQVYNILMGLIGFLAGAAHFWLSHPLP
ncbi:hypothetical protein [Methanolapillus africanus]|uniref:hypothetical protein n=1 Tax=Methanolapillus africanus TaxID=3028297 RepID=UPI0030B8ED08